MIEAFTSLKPVVKIFLILAFVAVALGMMYFAAQTDTFDLLLKGLFGGKA